jgi:general stress protein YciG
MGNHTEGETVMTTERKERRGFASMSAEKQREIASKGGRAAHEKGTAHEWTADEARNAGRKGGQVSRGGRGRLVDPSEAPQGAGTVADIAAENRAE